MTFSPDRRSDKLLAMSLMIATVVLMVGLVIGIRIALRRAAQQRATHDARLQAMARTYFAAAAKKKSAPHPVETAVPPPQPAREERECPFCAELILKKAKVCKHCSREVEPLI